VLVRAGGVDPAQLEPLAALLRDAQSPAFVAGAGNDSPEGWAALAELAERLAAPVFQESFGARAGFPQDHRHFAGVLPADRPRLRDRLSPYDVVVAVGAPVFRQSPYAEGRLAAEGTRLAIVSDDPAEVNRAPVELGVLAPPAAVCRQLARLVPQRDAEPPPQFVPPPAPAAAEPLTASDVLVALADRLPRDAVVVEEAPVDRPELHERLLARAPLGFLSAAMGGLGFGIPGATGVRMALPNRPVVGVIGDGSALYGIQGLWSAAHYGAGVLFVILSNGGYAIMDRLAERRGLPAPWPSFMEVDISRVAVGFGCSARRITTHDELTEALDDTIPTLAGREQPVLLDVVIAPTQHFSP